MYARHLLRLYFVEVFGHLQIDANPCIACESLLITSAFRAILFLMLFYFILPQQAFEYLPTYFLRLKITLPARHRSRPPHVAL